MIRKKNREVEWLEFELLAHIPFLTHGIFLRHGGMSQDSFASLNVKFDAGDEEKNVFSNRKLILQSLGIKKIIGATHQHGIEIEPATDSKTLFCDGLVTNQKNIGLLTTHADCQAAIFYDPINNAIANVHAGWRGQMKNIYAHTIQKMSQIFGSKSQDLLVCISPSLGPSYSEFKNYEKEIPKEYWSFQVKSTYFDLWAIAQYQLESAGMRPEHIEIAKIDTYANAIDFYSYRREKALGKQEKITGCHGTVVALKNCCL